MITSEALTYGTYIYIYTFINAGISDPFQSNCRVRRLGLGLTDPFPIWLSQTTAGAQVRTQIAY